MPPPAIDGSQTSTPAIEQSQTPTPAIDPGSAVEPKASEAGQSAFQKPIAATSDSPISRKTRSTASPSAMPSPPPVSSSCSPLLAP